MERKIVWNDALRSGLVLGGVSIAYMVVNMLLSKLHGGAAVGVLVNVGSLLLWVFKFYICIRLFKLFMLRFAAAHEETTNADSFRFGFATALLSALLYSAFYLAWVSFIQPDMFNDAIELAKETYSNMLTADQLDSFGELAPKMPGMMFFANLIYCTLFGTVLSAIFSRNIPSRNPFN
ncbi:MAG: DUF4199 domain-containing protein [Bacteroidales bacterium]|nr:DUF4199 domain-containing protein [Bacteroidales bacterium]